jgi:uncharacterized repeat protein (TIGR01451 family)
MIALFDAAVPTGWTLVSTPASSYYQRLLKGSSSFGLTGGSATHNHAGAVSVVSGAPSSTNSFNSGFTTVSVDSHTHTVNYSVNSQTSLPVYRDVMLAKYTAFSLLDTKSLTGSILATSDLSTSNKDIVAVNGGAVSYTPTDGAAEANVGNTAIPESTPITFAIHVRNTGTAAVTGDITITDTLTNMVKPTAGFSENLTCNGVACVGYSLLTPVYNSGAKTITFTIHPTSGSLAPGNFMSVRYTVLPIGPTGVSATIFRFTNQASISYNSGANTVNCTGLPVCPLQTPLVLFFRDLSVPFLREVQ